MNTLPCPFTSLMHIACTQYGTAFPPCKLFKPFLLEILSDLPRAIPVWMYACTSVSSVPVLRIVVQHSHIELPLSLTHSVSCDSHPTPLPPPPSPSSGSMPVPISPTSTSYPLTANSYQSSLYSLHCPLCSSYLIVCLPVNSMNTIHHHYAQFRLI